MTTNDSLDDIDLSGVVHRGWDDVRGWLIWDSALPDELQRREDQTQSADYERRGLRRVDPEVWRRAVQFKAADNFRGFTATSGWERPTTAAERALLIYLGFTVPAGAVTFVSYPSGGIRRREWPQLQDQYERMN